LVDWGWMVTRSEYIAATLLFTYTGLYHMCGFPVTMPPVTLTPFNVPTFRTTWLGLSSAAINWRAQSSYPTPLTITSCALEMAIASELFTWYSCGSAFGSVTMLRTEVWLPPSWDIRLPQKFSAATT